MCGYEVAATFSKRAPTLTEIARRRPWLGPVLVGALTIHLYRERAWRHALLRDGEAI